MCSDVVKYNENKLANNNFSEICMYTFLKLCIYGSIDLYMYNNGKVNKIIINNKINKLLNVISSILKLLNDSNKYVNIAVESMRYFK